MQKEKWILLLLDLPVAVVAAVAANITKNDLVRFIVVVVML